MIKRTAKTPYYDNAVFISYLVVRGQWRLCESFQSPASYPANDMVLVLTCNTKLEHFCSDFLQAVSEYLYHV